jgi:hypothetical protein
MRHDLQIVHVFFLMLCGASATIPEAIFNQYHSPDNALTPTSDRGGTRESVFFSIFFFSFPPHNSPNFNGERVLRRRAFGQLLTHSLHTDVCHYRSPCPYRPCCAEHRCVFLTEQKKKKKDFFGLIYFIFFFSLIL